MKKFLAIYLGSAEAMAKWMAMEGDEKESKEKAGMEAWMKWATENKKSIVDMGSPIGKTKLVNKDGVSEVKNEIGAYTVVEAESHEEAAKLFLNHPHFTHFPGDRIEVMECLPMPKI